MRYKCKYSRAGDSPNDESFAPQPGQNPAGNPRAVIYVLLGGPLEQAYRLKICLESVLKHSPYRCEGRGDCTIWLQNQIFSMPCGVSLQTLMCILAQNHQRPYIRETMHSALNL